MWILLITTLVAVCPTLLIKKYLDSSESNLLLFILALILYVVLAFCYLTLYKDNELSKTFTLLHVCEILLVTFIGVVFFKDQLTPRIVIGTILGIIAFILLHK